MAITTAPLVALGRNVRSHREKLKLTQEALGERAELHTTYISDIERGVRNPCIVRARKAGCNSVTEALVSSNKLHLESSKHAEPK